MWLIILAILVAASVALWIAYHDTDTFKSSVDEVTDAAKKQVDTGVDALKTKIDKVTGDK